MKRILFSLIVLISFSGIAQQELNNYKYIVVPKKFEGFKRTNQYQTSTLVKYLFVERGFTVIYDDALPEDLNKNRCLGLFADLKEDSSMFSTKLQIALKDCNDQEVFISQIGISKEKDFKSAYSEAIRAAFISYNGLTYEYKPTEKESEAPIKVSFKDDVKQMEPEREAQAETEKNEMVTQKATLENQTYKDQTPVNSTVKKVEKEVVSEVMEKPMSSANNEMLYAQEIANGYQIVDSTPKILYRLYRSSVPNLYHAQTESKKGIVLNREGKWFFEYYEGDELQIEELAIKF